MRNDAVGEVAARVEHRQPRFRGGPVRSDMLARDKAPDGFGHLGGRDSVSLG